MTSTLPTQPAAEATEEGAGPQLSKAERRRLSEGARAEQHLGWILCAPAVIVMVAVAAFPMGYAIYLSLERYDLRFPNLAKFVGLSNYGAVLSNGYWWHAFAVTVAITIISVAVEFAIGMTFALLMHRTLVGRGAVRTLILIPYGLVTVIAAYGWQYAWT
ncbi:MAG TPA: sugar ABC transporter permease, partial [Acidimicrobiales bacterium]|nr:sugar ABC transporter permease [Acidimicrobiales bacterium]